MDAADGNDARSKWSEARARGAEGKQRGSGRYLSSFESAPPIALALVKLATEDISVGRYEGSDTVLMVCMKLAVVNLTTRPNHFSWTAQLAHIGGPLKPEICVNLTKNFDARNQ